MNKKFERIGNALLLGGCILFTLWLLLHGTAVQAMTMFAATGLLYWLQADVFSSGSAHAPALASDATGLSVSETAITLFKAGQSETLPLSDLQAVKILTNDSGPFGHDLFFVLEGAWGVRAISGELDDCQHLFGLFDRLPNFDHQQSVQAMGSTENAVFEVWHAPTQRTSL